MYLFKKTIFTGFSPNLTFRDTVLAVSYLIFPWKWFSIDRGKNVALVEQEIEKYFNIKYCHAFDSGRSALYFVLKSMGIKAGDEVLLQAYTCMVVVNAIKWIGATPIFVDIENDLNINIKDLEKKVSKNSKVILAQHTFGLSCDMDGIMAVAKKNNLLVVEDCAHAFGTKYSGHLVGTIGDAAILSFGSDKVLSSVRGGAVITNNKTISIALKCFQDNLPEPKVFKTVQHLMHYPAFFKGKLFYDIYLGKILLAFAKKINLINKIIYAPEKRGEQVDFYPAKYANSLANILLNQLKEVDQINIHRQAVSAYYDANLKTKKIISPWVGLIKKENSIYLRYPVLTGQSAILRKYAKKQKIILGDWYNSVIAPMDIDFRKTDYQPGSCQNAESIASRSVNLPTDRHISIKDAERIVDLINKF